MKSFILIFTAITIQLTAQDAAKEAWINAVIDSMSLEEKVGQVFMIRAFSKNDDAHIKSVQSQIEKYKVGGVCFFQGTPMKQVELVNDYQSRSKLPLMVAMDGEWGLGMRFPKTAISFPRALTIGAINDHQLIYRMGQEMGRQFKIAGVNVNFGPVVDVNNNAANPVINNRSFGEDRFNVASKAYAYMEGLHAADVMSCAKHFPGHGDTGTDSHYDLPVIAHDRDRLDSIELFPFQMMIDQGIPSVMVAHLQMPAIDNRPNRPTSVSRKVVTELLRQDMGFTGLTFTDAMEMKGITEYFTNGQAEVEAFIAGNDIILLPSNVDEAVPAVIAAVKEGRISNQRLEESVRRVLSAKYDLGLFKNSNKATDENLDLEINSREAQVIKSQIYERAITLAKDEQNVFPIKELRDQSFASIALGTSTITPFQKRLSSYADVENTVIPKSSESSLFDSRLSQLEKKDVVFVSIHDMSKYASKDFGIDPNQINFIERLSQKTKVVLVLFGSPYALAKFESTATVAVAYEEDELAQEAAAQAFMGANDITGRLPVSASSIFTVGSGLSIPGLNRLGYTIPEAVGLNSDTLARIQEIVEELIEKKAAPGCQVLVARNNKVVYHKAFGHHTYDRKIPVTLTDIYDVASVTKVMASTLSAMHLQDQGLFDLKNPIRQYIPEEDTTNKANLTYEDILAHVGGLKPWIPFYRNTVEGEKIKKPSPRYYRPAPVDSFSITVMENLYLRNDYRDTVWRKIFSSPLRDTRDYRYSDLAFYIMNRTVKNISGYEVDGYAEMNFYHPLGLRKTMFNPYRIIEQDQIVPSEKDDYWRHKVVDGYVHDMGAAMLGGVSGHAGLFSNSYEIGVLLQMMLNNGQYGGREYLSPRTVNYYTQRHWRSSRRGIGWDMKELNPEKTMNMSEKASRHSFGHLGFTGTAAFADPDYDLVFVFLSNRTYPTMRNNKLGKNDYRPKIQSVVYDALMLE